MGLKEKGLDQYYFYMKANFAFYLQNQGSGVWRKIDELSSEVDHEILDYDIWFFSRFP